jgi:hypothetical protein
MKGRWAAGEVRSLKRALLWDRGRLLKSTKRKTAPPMVGGAVAFSDFRKLTY